MGRIKAVLFDMDGVLVDSFEAHYAWLASLAEEKGYKKFKKGDYAEVFGSDRRNKIKSLTGEKSEQKLDEMMEFAHSRENAFPTELYKMPKDEDQVLRALSSRYKLGIVTSGTVRSVDRLFGVADMKRYFTVVVAREDYANPKPNPEPLLLAAKKLGVRPSESVYIGDSDVDIVAGHAANMKVIGYSSEEMDGADETALSFAGIPDSVQRLEGT